MSDIDGIKYKNHVKFIKNTTRPAGTLWERGNID